MINTVLTVLGGVGVFLLGMIIMTDALKKLAGDAMRQLMMRFTSNAASGALTGALATAVLQSSSATTVAAVGFVAAGLLSFTESLGIIFGANIGTTITGWLVVLVGFKLSLSKIMLPVIFIGVALKLFTRKRLAATGMALAGFGLVFVGISIMQDAMATLQGSVTPDVFPEDSWSGRLQLFLLGMVVTIITQSSSAGVAMALTAVFAGTINFEQAAAMVIGMDVGTTSTAAMATIGGKVSARRTGLSHVVYNLMTGVAALLLLTPYTQLADHLVPGILETNPEVALVAFHTSFNALGVLVILPFASHFARFIEKVVPEKGSAFTASLEPGLLKDNSAALSALSISVQMEAVELFHHLQYLLGDASQKLVATTDELQDYLNKTHRFAERILVNPSDSGLRQQFIALVHALDHMQRLHERIEEDVDRAASMMKYQVLDELRSTLAKIIQETVNNGSLNIEPELIERADVFSAEITHQAVELRDRVMAEIAEGSMNVQTATQRLEAIRWLRRVSVHVKKIIFYMGMKTA